MIKKLIVGKEPDERSLFLWNMIGSGIYALASLILTYLTIRIIGDRQGGIFAIALTLGQMFIYIAYYEMRNYEVTDASDEFTFAQYHGVKIINCAVMMAVTVIYILLKDYSFYKSLVVFLVCLYRMLDGYADVYEAQFHHDGRLDLAGKSMAWRTVISVGVYFIILSVTHDLIWSVIGAIISGIAGILIFNVYIFDSVGRIEVSFDPEGVKGILVKCFPMFLGMFLWTYLLSASRIAVDNAMDSQYQSYYQVLFMPVSVINLLAGFLIRPSLIKLTELYSQKRFREFTGVILKISACLAAFTALCMAAAYICGIPVLEILVKCPLDEYRGMFVFLIFAGGINALAYTLYFVLSIFRAGKSIIAGYGTASVVALIISTPMTRRWGLWGASWSYLISIAVLLVLFMVFAILSAGRTAKKASDSQS